MLRGDERDAQGAATKRQALASCFSTRHKSRNHLLGALERQAGSTCWALNHLTASLYEGTRRMNGGVTILTDL